MHGLPPHLPDSIVMRSRSFTMALCLVAMKKSTAQ
jgi:hypothetical protein